MATATLKNVTVNKVFGASYQGASVYEEFEFTARRGPNKGKKQTGKQYYTLWNKGGEPFEFDEGDVLGEVTGRLSATVDEYEDKETGETKHSAKITLNDVEVAGQSSGSGDAGEDEDW